MKTRAQLNRQIRQEALREQLAKQKHAEHLIDLVNKINDPTVEISREMLDRYKVVIDTRKFLIGKYLPDMKSVEISGDADAPLVTKTEVELVRPKNQDS